MPVLYSNVPPLRTPKGKHTLPEYMNSRAAVSDCLYIATGYASKNSLNEISGIVSKYGIRKVVLVLGMYYIEGFPESIYNMAREIDSEWRSQGIGEIRLTKSMKYHGKVYGFYKDGKITSAVIGSHNLGALCHEAGNLRQYEISMYTEDLSECSELDEHLKSVISAPVSLPFSELKIDNVVHEENTKLNGVEGVVKVSADDVASNKAAQTGISFEIPLKVPGMPLSNQDFMKSNVNKCYAKGRMNTRTGVITERGWWETEIIVSKSTTSKSTYPERDVPFFVITDDGWKFKMHVAGDYSKNLESHGDLKILGYWLKGRLVAAGFIEPVDSPAADLENVVRSGADIYRKCKGVITYQKLQKYGRTAVTLTKTLNKLADDDGTMLDVWVLSFLPDNVK